ncbi:S41 family peptidase [Desulfotomaculum copahuensis]|uniref:Peptidase S41 n=1 Tax=Desulfotomaculum copahuensis TaxID=1838280 RepID=A0A1B7LBX3_9FIRM|nr:S41 family peptidase [Desulfotomaculum copahuensis]OAT80238.1 peptidase S41 [Desulfotomaculum copahuensis]
MSFYEDGSRSRVGRWLVALAAVLFLIFVVVGGLFAVNYKNLGNLIKVVSLVRTQYLQPVGTTTLVDGAMRGIVESLGDPYSVYLDPKTYASLQEQIRGSFGGLGILVGLQDHYLTVARAYGGTPAQKAGIKKGDIITRINGRDARDIDLETAIGLMRGPVGTTISLTIARKGVPQPWNVELTREEISVPTVEGKIIPGTQIGYIAISQFTEKTPQEMDSVVAQLKSQHMRAVLLDLRDNPGGELQSAVKVANYFVPKGPVVYIDYRSGRDETYSSNGQNLGLPLVVLVNGNSASAAEILSGAIKDTRAGTLVGEKTFGKGIVQTVFDLGNGAGLKLTTARYLTPARHDINKKGIMPDVVVEQPAHATVDLQMQKGIELLKEKLGEKAAA